MALEAVEFAGHQQLDNLILIYDSNAVTLDAMAKETQSQDTAKHFEALGFDVQTIDGHEMDAFASAFARAKAAGSGKPQLIIAKTLIGKGIPEVQGTQKAHGEGGAKFSEEARKGLGLPAEHFYVSDEVRAHFAAHEKSSTPATLPGRKSSRPGRPRIRSWPMSWLARARSRTRRAPRHPRRTWPACSPPFRSSPPTARSRRARPAKTCCSPWPRRTRYSSAAAPICTARPLNSSVT